MTLAILSALPQELAALQACLDRDRVTELAGRQLHHGRLAGRPVILALAGVGKVAAATTATLLLDRWAAEALLFTGVAGGLGAGVRVGDVVVAREALQHDMNASPLFARWEVPFTGRSRFAADPRWADRLASAARQVLAGAHPALAGFGLQQPVLHEGLVISGDQFINADTDVARLRADLPDALAVEMEGAAVAQVAQAFGRPWGVLRSVSDRADDSAHLDFPRFLKDVAAPYHRDILLAALSG